jgi:hypothetical protein
MFIHLFVPERERKRKKERKKESMDGLNGQLSPPIRVIVFLYDLSAKLLPSQLGEDKQVVGSGNCNRVLIRMPGSMKDLLGEVN